MNLAFYIDPWKSDERAKTVVLVTEQNVEDLKSEDTFVLKVKDSLESLISISKTHRCGIDCDLYQFVYSLNIGLSLM